MLTPRSMAAVPRPSPPRSELVARWERGDGLLARARLGELLDKMQFPGHGLNAADLAHAIAGLEHVESCPGGRDLRGYRLEQALVGVDLAGFDLSYATLGADLVDCDLRGARLDEATADGILLLSRLDGVSARAARLVACDLHGVPARGAIFDDAVLAGSSFMGADLTGASFRGARARRTSFERAILAGCDFRRAVLDEATFVDARVSSSTNLDDARLDRLNLRHT